MTQPPPPDRAGVRLDRRAAAAVLVTALLVLAGAAALLVPWDWVPGGTLTPARAVEEFPAHHLARAERYSGEVRLLSHLSYAVSLGVAVLLGLTRLGSTLTRRLAGVAGRLLGRRRTAPWWAVAAAAVLLLLLVGRLATLPFGLLIRRRRVEEALTTQGIAGWLTDRALSLLVSWALVAALVILVMALARRWPRRWFLPAGVAAAGMTFTGSLLYPVAVEPLFHDFTPLKDGPFKASVLRLAEAEGVQVEEVLVADASRRTTTLNAYVSGLGATRRVVLYDNLLADVPPDQARAVVAHELAHARHGDVALGTGLGALGTVAGMAALALLMDSRWLRRRAGITGPGDPAAAAALAALVAVGGLVAAPVQNTVSRAIEARADRTALSATGDPEAFRQVQRQLAVSSLADPTPPVWSHLWFGSHPTVLQRLGLPSSLARTGSGQQDESGR